MTVLRRLVLPLSIGAGYALAQSNQITNCPVQDICYSLSIPQRTASSGSGDIFFQLSAPTSQQWIALGQGTQMSDANMFIMYSSANGQNVTVSSRRSSGHVMPQQVTDVNFSLLEGSGIVDGKMIANVRCSNCNSWPGGAMNFQTGSSSWIYSYRTGSALNSDSGSASISKHDDHGDIQFDVSQARTSDTSNPFITSSGTTTPANSSSTSSGSSSTQQGGGDSMDMYITAHGSLATVAFVALYPIGALLIRFANFPGAVWVHAAIQALAYVVFIAGAGIGIWVARQLSYVDQHHAIIGLVLLSVIFFMPILGLAHHKMYKKTESRGVFSYLHIYIGRAVILLGIINGGLGLQLAEAERGELIAYGVCAGVVGVAYIAGFVFGEARRSRNRRTASATSGEGKTRDSSS